MKRVVRILLAACLVATVASAQVGGGGAGGLQARFLAGQEAMKEGRLPQAADEFRAALELDPSLSEARANLGLVLFLQGQYAETVRHLERVVADRPEIGVAHLFLGLGRLKLGQPSEAIPALERSLREQPGNLDARRALAACYLATRDFAGALREYKAIFAANEDKADAWYRLGRDYVKLMTELAGGLVVGQPDSVWASRLGADMLGLSAAWDAAAQYYEAALGKQPRLPGLHSSLARVLLIAGDAEAAERHFQAELEIDPLSEAAWLGLVEIRLAEGDAAAALKMAGVVWSSNPSWLLAESAFPLRRIPPDAALGLAARLPRVDGGPSRFLQAALYTEAGDGERAELQRSLLRAELDRTPAPQAGGLSAEQLCRSHRYLPCVQALQAQPTLSRADLLRIGRAYIALGRVEQAAVAFTHAMKGSVDPVPEASYWAVRALRMLADECFRQVEVLAPGSWRVHQLRAEAHRQRQDDDQAVAEYRKAIALKPDEPELHGSLGLIHLLNNDYDQAEAALHRALELDASSPRTLYLAGRLHVARQQHAESIRYLEAALRLDPNLVEARPSLGRAYLRARRFDEAAAQLEQGAALDYYGDIHYSLFQAYRQLGRLDDAKRALERSTALRRTSFARDRSKFDRWMPSE